MGDPELSNRAIQEIRRLAHEEAAKMHAAIETACEAALQTMDSGVSITYFIGGDWEVKVDPDVPYGQIWEQRNVRRLS